MAWSTRKLRKRWKGRPWITIPFARKYLVARSLYHAMGVSHIAVAHFGVQQIRCTPTRTPEEKARKRAAMAESWLAGVDGYGKVMKKFEADHAHMRASKEV